MARKAPKTAPKLSSGAQLDEAALIAQNDEQEPDITVFRPDREGIRKVLGDLEADVMDYIWENSPPNRAGITVREVYEAFRLNRVIAYTTVMTTMARLARKHLLKPHKVDNAYVYSPNMTKEAFIDNFVSRILENLLVSFSQVTESHLERLTSEYTLNRITALKTRVAGLRENQATDKA